MKNKFSKSFLIVFSVLLLSFSTVLAAGVTKNIKVQWNSLSVYVNGKKVTGNNIVYGGTVYVPLKTIADGLNKNTVHDKKKNKITVTDKERLYTKKEVDKMISQATSKLYTKTQLDKIVSQAIADNDAYYNGLGFLATQFDSYQWIYFNSTRVTNEVDMAVESLNVNSIEDYNFYHNAINNDLATIKSDLDFINQNKIQTKTIFASYGGNPTDIDITVSKLNSAYNELLLAKQNLENYKLYGNTTYASNVYSNLINASNHYHSAFDIFYPYQTQILSFIVDPYVENSVSTLSYKSNDGKTGTKKFISENYEVDIQRK